MSNLQNSSPSSLINRPGVLIIDHCPLKRSSTSSSNSSILMYFEAALLNLTWTGFWIVKCRILQFHNELLWRGEQSCGFLWNMAYSSPCGVDHKGNCLSLEILQNLGEARARFGILQQQCWLDDPSSSRKHTGMLCGAVSLDSPSISGRPEQWLYHQKPGMPNCQMSGQITQHGRDYLICLCAHILLPSPTLQDSSPTDAPAARNTFPSEMPQCWALSWRKLKRLTQRVGVSQRAVW